MTPTRNCVECGAPIPEGADSCPECGLMVDGPGDEKQGAASGSRATERDEAATGSRAQEHPPAKPRHAASAGDRSATRAQGGSSSRGVRNFIIGLAVVAGLVVVFMLYLRNQTPSNADSAQNTQAQNGRVTAGAEPGQPAAADGQAGALPGGEEEKIKLLRQLLAKQPDNTTHILALANALYDAGHYAEAAPYYERGVAADPGNNDVRVDLATCYFHSDHADKAVKQLDTVLTHDPRHANALYNRGVMEKSMGHDEEAFRYWRAYLQYNPVSPHADEVRALLAGGGMKKHP